MADTVENFCEHPNGDLFRTLSSEIQYFTYNVALYCISEDIGDISLAEKIITYYRFGQLSNDQKRDIRAIYVGLKMLTLPEFAEVQDRLYPRLSIHDKDNYIIYSITYGHDLPDMFSVKQRYNVLGVDKDMELYEDNMKEEILNSIWKYSLDINRIYLEASFKNENKSWIMYDRNVGLIKDSNDCLKCDLFLNKYNIDCETLAGNRMYIKKLYLKYHPDKIDGDREIFEQLKKCDDLCASKDCMSNIRFRPEYKADKLYLEKVIHDQNILDTKYKK